MIESPNLLWRYSLLMIHTSLFVTALIVQSCDVPGLIILKNKSNALSHVQYQAKESQSPLVREFNFKGPPDSTSIEIFGFGYWWTNNMIEDYSRYVDTFRISNSEGVYIITDSIAMSQYMRSARSKGLFKASWTIKSPMKRKNKKHFNQLESDSN